ncbi:MAG: DUF819 family protein, partial [Myxococcales bacterium]
LCYGFGILAANVPGPTLNTAAALQLAELSVPIALPLLLVTADLKSWRHLARPTLISLALACVSAVTVAYGVGRLYAGELDEGWKVAGMLVGTYTGGTANMSAIGLALEVKRETFILLNAADVVLGGLYFFFLLSLAQRVLLLFLPKFRDELREGGGTWDEGVMPGPRQLAVNLAVSVVVLGVSAGLTLLLMGELFVPVLLLFITTFALAGSTVSRIRALPGAWKLGEYLLLVFCVAIGSLANLRTLADADPRIFAFTAMVMLGAAALHFALAAAFRLDADTVVITSTATIFGPAFVGPVAQALKNRQLVISGVTAGLIGFAVGNYLGLATAYLLRP